MINGRARFALADSRASVHVGANYYSATEARLSGYGENPVGRNMFDISACMGSDNFRGRVTRAMEQGPVDLEFGWPGDFADPKRELRIRVQSSRSGGVWMFIERD